MTTALKTRRAPRAGASNRGMASLWAATVRDKHDRVKLEQFPHANLRVNTGNDWQAVVMGGGSLTSFTGISGAATSVTATTLTNTGAAFPTTAVMNGATGGLAGKIIACGPNSSGAGSTVYGVILSNTATVITVDRWVAAGTPFSAGTTPNGTCTYQILPGAAPAIWMALGSTVITPATGDTVLAGELTSSGFTRAGYTTLTHTGASSSYSLANTFTATGTQTINGEALFTASGTAGVATAANAGLMTFESSEPSPPTLVSGDTLVQTVSVSY